MNTINNIKFSTLKSEEKTDNKIEGEITNVLNFTSPWYVQLIKLIIFKVFRR